MSRIHTISAPDRTFVRFMDDTDEHLNRLLDASEVADRSRVKYRAFFIQTFCAIAIVAVQTGVGVDSKVMLRGLLLGWLVVSAIFWAERSFAIRRYQRLRDEWRETNKDDPSWKELKS